jgi:uncharacterized membrane protein
MNFTVATFPAWWHWVCAGAVAAIGVDIALRAPWRRLADGARLNPFLGTVVVLVVLWSIRTGLPDGLDFHLLGASACALAFGPRLAIAAMALVTLGAAAAGSLEWGSLPVNLLVMGVWPVLVTTAVLRGLERWLPGHFFVYVFGAAFFGAALAMVATGVLASALLGLGGQRLDDLLSGYLPWYALMAWAEAFTTGAALTLMVVYRPDWVATFDDARYLRNR